MYSAADIVFFRVFQKQQKLQCQWLISLEVRQLKQAQSMLLLSLEHLIQLP
jgi:hypothetical protein